MIRLNMIAAIAVALLILNLNPAIAGDEAASGLDCQTDPKQADSGSALQDRPLGWWAKEIPHDGWVFNIKVTHEGSLLREVNVLYPLNYDNPYYLYSDHLTQGYKEGETFIPASLIRNFVLIVREQDHAAVLAAEPWEANCTAANPARHAHDWPKSMGSAAFRRLIEHSTHLQTAELHAYVYSDAGNEIELNIDRVVNNYSIEAMVAPELPLAGQLLREINVDSIFEEYARLSLQTRPGGLGWLDSLGNTVVLPGSVTQKQLEARR